MDNRFTENWLRQKTDSGYCTKETDQLKIHQIKKLNENEYDECMHFYITWKSISYFVYK